MGLRLRRWPLFSLNLFRATCRESLRYQAAYPYVNQMLYTWVCLVLQWINESLRGSVRQALAKGGGERSWKGNPSPCGSPYESSKLDDFQQDFGRKRCWSIGSKGHLESKILVHIRRNFHLLSPPLSNGSSKGPRSLFYCFRCPCTINSAWHLASEHL